MSPNPRVASLERAAIWSEWAAGAFDGEACARLMNDAEHIRAVAKALGAFTHEDVRFLLGFIDNYENEWGKGEWGGETRRPADVERRHGRARPAPDRPMNDYIDLSNLLGALNSTALYRRQMDAQQSALGPIGLGGGLNQHALAKQQYGQAQLLAQQAQLMGAMQNNVWPRVYLPQPLGTYDEPEGEPHEWSDTARGLFLAAVFCVVWYGVRFLLSIPGAPHVG